MITDFLFWRSIRDSIKALGSPIARLDAIWTRDSTALRSAGGQSATRGSWILVSSGDQVANDMLQAEMLKGVRALGSAPENSIELWLDHILALAQRTSGRVRLSREPSVGRRTPEGIIVAEERWRISDLRDASLVLVREILGSIHLAPYHEDANKVEVSASDFRTVAAASEVSHVRMTQEAQFNASQKGKVTPAGYAKSLAVQFDVGCQSILDILDCDLTSENLRACEKQIELERNRFCSFFPDLLEGEWPDMSVDESLKEVRRFNEEIESVSMGWLAKVSRKMRERLETDPEGHSDLVIRNKTVVDQPKRRRGRPEHKAGRRQDKKIVGMNLKKRCEQLDLGYDEVAEKLEASGYGRISSSTVAKHFQGVHSQHDKIAAYASILSCSVENLIDGVSNRDRFLAAARKQRK